MSFHTDCVMRVLECFLNSLVLHFGLCLYLKEDPDFAIGGVTENRQDRKKRKRVIWVCICVLYCILKTFDQGLLINRLKMFWY